MRCVVVDRWDEQDLASVSVVRSFRRARERVGDVVDDVFFVLLKSAPEIPLVVPDELEDRRGVIELLAGLESVQSLRLSTIGDPYAAAIGAVRLAAVVEQMLEELALDPGAGVDGVVAGHADGVGEAAETATERLEGQAEAAAAWGVEPGELKRRPISEREALVERLDSDRVRAIADLFGRLRADMFAAPPTVEAAPATIVDVELGDDLPWVLGGEWLGLVDAGLEPGFLARLANGELTQFEVAGDEAGRGGIILCVDGSGTMGHEFDGFTREMWAQALKLFLLRMCQEQGRALHVIDFGGRGEYQLRSFMQPEDFSPLRVLETVGVYYGCGTHFETPLRQAVKVATMLSPGADVVFVSDGDAVVSPTFFEGYRSACERLGMRTFGVLVKARGKMPFVDRLWSIRDMRRGSELGELLTALSD